MAYFVIGLMNGQRTFDEIRILVESRHGERSPSKEELVSLLIQLNNADVLISGTVPDSTEFVNRSREQRRRRRLLFWRSPLSLRFPLVDPERFLNWIMPFFRPLFSWLGLAFWLLLVGGALFQVGVHWEEMTGGITDRVLAMENLFLMALVFPVVKLFHEFGHMLAVKHRGGEVHELGIMLLVLMPIPYVDASAANAFRERRWRVIVGMGGMLVELLIAAIAVFVWVSVEPGTVRAVAFNVIVVAGVSTLLFNLNPLLRYDGYYILMDWLEIPNLGSRANRYLGYLIQKYIMRLPDTTSPALERGEAGWFLFYSIAAFLYRLFIFVAIILFVASQYFVVGVLLAVWASFSMFVLPVIKHIRFLLFDNKVQRNRWPAMVGVSLMALAFGLLLFGLPLPHRTLTQGVTWSPLASQVRAGADCFVDKVLATSGDAVAAGSPLLTCSDPDISERVQSLETQLAEVRTRYEAALTMDRVVAGNLREEMSLVSQWLEDAKSRQDKLTVRNQRDGILLLPGLADDLPGRFIMRGDLIGFVVADEAVTIRVAIRQREVDLIRNNTRSVQVRFSDQLAKVYSAIVVREIPAATRELPSTALSLAGGGDFVTDPRSENQDQAMESLFVFEIEVPEVRYRNRLGDRAYLLFEHDPESAGVRIIRSIRRLLLRNLDV
jgi:putative peptide zinc metalloprotease protein